MKSAEKVLLNSGRQAHARGLYAYQTSGEENVNGVLHGGFPGSSQYAYFTALGGEPGRKKAAVLLRLSGKAGNSA